MDSQLSSSIIEQFCEILAHSAPYTEHPDPRNKKDIIRIATPKTIAASFDIIVNLIPFPSLMFQLHIDIKSVLDCQCYERDVLHSRNGKNCPKRI